MSGSFGDFEFVRRLQPANFGPPNGGDQFERGPDEADDQTHKI